MLHRNCVYIGFEITYGYIEEPARILIKVEQKVLTGKSVSKNLIINNTIENRKHSFSSPN